jgi:hypothetical protein
VSERLRTLSRRASELIARFPDPGLGYAEMRDGMARLADTAAADPAAALVRVRKTLQFVVDAAYMRAFNEPPGTRPLENLLQRLGKEADFPKRLAAYANLVRDLGNVGAHTFDKATGTDDVTLALEQLLPILEWHAGTSAGEDGGSTKAVGEPPRTEPTDHPDPLTGRRRRPFLVAVLGMAASLAVVAGLLWRGRPQMPPPPESLLPDWANSLAAAPALRRVYGGVPPGESEGRITLTQTLRYHLQGAEQWHTLEDGAELSSAHGYRLQLTPGCKGYLYVFQVDTSGKLNVLFPALPVCQYSEGKNPVKADGEIRIPAGSPLTLDENRGVEHVYTVLTLARWPELEADLESCERNGPRAGGEQEVQQPLLLALRGVGGKEPQRDGSGQASTEAPVARSGNEFVAGRARGLVVERWFLHVAPGP